MKFPNLLATIDETETIETNYKTAEQQKASNEKTAGVFLALIAAAFIIPMITAPKHEKELSQAEKYANACYAQGGKDCNAFGKTLEAYLGQ